MFLLVGAKFCLSAFRGGIQQRYVKLPNPLQSSKDIQRRLSKAKPEVHIVNTECDVAIQHSPWGTLCLSSASLPNTPPFQSSEGSESGDTLPRYLCCDGSTASPVVLSIIQLLYESHHFSPAAAKLHSTSNTTINTSHFNITFLLILLPRLSIMQSFNFFMPAQCRFPAELGRHPDRRGTGKPDHALNVVQYGIV